MKCWYCEKLFKKNEEKVPIQVQVGNSNVTEYAHKRKCRVNKEVKDD